MTELLVVGVVALLVIAAAAVYGPRLGVAAPLVLVVVGIVASLVPWIPDFHIEPEWILEGVLPPLLYSSAVSMPSMNFRREFGAISGLSVVLVVATSLVLGIVFALLVPGLGFAWGVALGAIISPTDAVATSIIKQQSVSRRAVAILDGESLLNDATALVLLRTAIVATAASFSFWGALGTFAYSVAVAAAVGAVVGWLNLAVRKRIDNATVNTVLSFTVPFLASIPVEILGASGLVAAVVAGIITGRRAPRVLSPQSRLSDRQNWQTVELVLEGAVFLTMGLQLSSIIADVDADHAGVGTAIGFAVLALLVTIAVRAVYVLFLLLGLAAARRRGERMQPRLREISASRDDPEARDRAMERFRRGSRTFTARDLARFSTRITRTLADIDYFLKQPLGWREGSVVVWAGMRGAVTVAAAQTLPDDAPYRSLLVLVAFGVAALSLLVQGGTIGWLLKLIGPHADSPEEDSGDAEQTRLLTMMRQASEDIPRPEDTSGHPSKQFALARITAQRTALLDARDDGTFDADMLDHALENLDAMQITLELQGGPNG